MPSSVQIVGTGQLLQVSRRLRAVSGARVQRNLARRIRRAAEPLRRDLQRTIRTQDLPGQGRTKRGGPSPTTRPFRVMLAGGVRISVRAGANPGARVWFDKSRVEPGARNVVWQIEDGRLRHPVFGNRRRWTNQRPRAGWWSRTVRAAQPAMQAEIRGIVDDIRRDLT